LTKLLPLPQYYHRKRPHFVVLTQMRTHYCGNPLLFFKFSPLPWYSPQYFCGYCYCVTLYWLQ